MAAARCFSDTSDFLSIRSGDHILLDGRRFLVTGEERERRFGIEDPKFWVKRVVEEETGDRKIAKLSFFESFNTRLGELVIRCYRSPEKEERILDLCRNHPGFMQGVTFPDAKGNRVRVLEIVRGKNFMLYLDSLRMPHVQYFETELPGILRHLCEAFAAIGLLHAHGFRHGDIRNDHIIVERRSGRYVWIDFDYDFEAPENPFGLDLFGIGNILIYAVGKVFHNSYMIKNDTYTYHDLIERLEPDDFSILHPNRLVNLRKLYPYVPVMLNNILMHFSAGTSITYASVDEIIEDLGGYLASL
ncbi:hypothetical protein DSCO28_29320 [Desulfosarcina ovata subsp. sediminis]|uniref:Protein kinase n=3 Tax=Desulfosarcina ovata TaxID=83564 RepID=A0A5K8AA31_9BACT|nr:hypothetical protein DSCO28_29320 [Desulfosarcina ovata subsp. sediminis]BBO89563.1 hypothetical protein DSCOOX_27430 [Desulfosarcina ovata subsp. ovata]